MRCECRVYFDSFDDGNRYWWGAVLEDMGGGWTRWHTTTSVHRSPYRLVDELLEVIRRLQRDQQASDLLHQIERRMQDDEREQDRPQDPNQLALFTTP